MLISAQESESGIPPSVIDMKKEEIKKRNVSVLSQMSFKFTTKTNIFIISTYRI